MTNQEFLIKHKYITEKGCWILNNRNNNGYEYYNEIGIHKLSNLIFNNVPLSSTTLHKCDNPPCWNPEHLLEGDQSDNRADSIAKGRSPNLFGKALEEKNQTHCIRGHEFTNENTRRYGGKRTCVECRKIRELRRTK